MAIEDIIYKNKIIVIPLTVFAHLSLLLIYEKKIFILNFGLIHIIDNKTLLLKKQLDECENAITDFIINKNYNDFY